MLGGFFVCLFGGGLFVCLFFCIYDHILITPVNRSRDKRTHRAVSHAVRFRLSSIILTNQKRAKSSLHINDGRRFPVIARGQAQAGELSSVMTGGGGGEGGRVGWVVEGGALFVGLFLCLFARLLICWCVPSFVCVFVYLFVRMCLLCLFVCLSVGCLLA